MLGHMFNIINGNAPTYLISGINMNQHRYSTQEQGNYHVLFREFWSNIIPVSRICHWNKLLPEIKQCPSNDIFKYQVKCLLYIKLSVSSTSSSRWLPML